MSRLTPAEVRLRLRFDIERLRTSSTRLVHVESRLWLIRDRLQSRARELTQQAMDSAFPTQRDEHPPRRQLWVAQARAAAELAHSATLQSIVRPSGRFAFVTAMAVNRWVAALQGLSDNPVTEGVVERHVQAGRLAHRTLRTLRPRSGMRKYCGVLTSAVVVAEFVHPENREHVDAKIVAGLRRARLDPKRSDEVILEAVSAALRMGARVAEVVADAAEPRTQELAARAESVEADVAAQFGGR
ncbi:MAG: hypothetical protein ACFB9M_08480 [Myxococcota bacterium]